MILHVPLQAASTSTHSSGTITVKKDGMMLPMRQITASHCWTHSNVSQSAITIAKGK